jgi:putative transposase
MKSQEFNKLFHCVYHLNYHLVLVTKYRRKCITPEILSRLKEILTELTLKWDSKILEFNGEPDHVHLLLEINPKVAPSIFVNNLKTVSSRLIRRDFLPHLKKYYWKEPVFWSRSYCILTCGGAPLSILKQYIQQQEIIERKEEGNKHASLAPFASPPSKFG